MLKAAELVQVGEYVLVERRYLGPVTAVEQSDVLPENTLIHYEGGMYETSGEVEVREAQLVRGKLPSGIKVLVEKVDDGHEYVTLHNGRVIDKGWTAGTRSDAKKLARTNLEAMGLLTDE